MATYIVQILNSDPASDIVEVEYYCTSIIETLDKVKEYIKDCFSLEYVQAYKVDMMQDYPYIFPLTKIVKKTDARHGEESLMDMYPKDRKKYLKYKYLGKPHLRTQ